jgi:hypothetical protein
MSRVKPGRDQGFLLTAVKVKMKRADKTKRAEIFTLISCSRVEIQLFLPCGAIVQSLEEAESIILALLLLPTLGVRLSLFSIPVRGGWGWLA